MHLGGNSYPTRIDSGGLVPGAYHCSAEAGAGGAACPPAGRSHCPAGEHSRRGSAPAPHLGQHRVHPSLTNGIDSGSRAFQGHALSLDGYTLSFATILPCLTGPSLTILGTVYFQAAEAGCLRFAQPSYSGGIYAEDCSLQDDIISDLDSPRLGRICVNQAGHDACDAVMPVASRTWGAIKMSYR